MKTFITSMNRKLYDSYGRKFIQGWSNFSSNDTQLVVCFEGENIPDSSELAGFDNINIIPLDSKKSINFSRKFGKFHQARGIVFDQTPDQKITAHYNYRFDAVRFSFKIFSIIKCIEENLINNDFAWIDSDIVCLKKFNSSDLDRFFPDKDQLASYLGRDSFPQPNPYSECGFIGYNYNSPDWRSFINDMLNIYINGDIFLLKEWHDCMVFDYCREHYSKSKKIKFKNLSGDLIGCDHPFNEIELSSFFDHLKGPERKLRGHS